MNRPRLLLKHSTGWFAAGREFTQALGVLSDGAFKLYVYTCLRADRFTGRLPIEPPRWAQALGKDQPSIARELAELEDRGVASITHDAGSNPVLEICDRFWPYQKQPAPATPEKASPSPAEFVQKVRALFLAPACVQASFSPADEKIAAALHRRGVSLELVQRAILLGCVRKYAAMINTGARMPITSLQYFSAIIEEITESAIPESYWEYLRRKLVQLEQRWSQTGEKTLNRCW